MNIFLFTSSFLLEDAQSFDHAFLSTSTLPLISGIISLDVTAKLLPIRLILAIISKGL